jgi:acetyl-CoA acyltransferase
LESIAMASAKIRSGMADCIIAGGTESMSLVPTAGWKTVSLPTQLPKMSRIII